VIVFETHSITEDNERGIATGWHPGRLSDAGRVLARELGDRRRRDGIELVFSSDLRRAVETAEIAFGATSIPILHDWRLRGCNYRRTERRGPRRARARATRGISIVRIRLGELAPGDSAGSLLPRRPCSMLGVIESWSSATMATR
jgi:broad specificity phosphatase PhoE